MITSRQLMRQVRLALAAAFALGGFASLLQLAVPLYALHVLESAIPSASAATLALLALIAAGALLGLVCLLAARDRILLRAGLWLDHTLGVHRLAAGARLGTAPATLQRDADALAAVARALTAGTAAALLDALWLPLFLAALALISPLVAAVAAACAGLMLLAIVLAAPRIGRLAQQRARDDRSSVAWWLTAGSAQPDAGLASGAAEQWERLNRPRIAIAYALGRRTVRLHDLARLVRGAAQVGLIAVGAWLVIGHALSPAGLVACVLIAAALLEPLERLVLALPAVVAAMAAYRRLDEMPDEAPADETAGASEASDVPATPPPRLDVRGPLAAGVAAVLLLTAAGVGAAFTKLSDVSVLASRPVFETRRAAVAYPAEARLQVAKGATVEAGDVVATLDTTELDRQITMLKALSEAVKTQLAVVGKETSELTTPADGAPVDRAKVASLEQRIGELERESRELLSRLAVAERELSQSHIRAPVSGRVVTLGMRSGETADARPTGALEIATADRGLLQRLFAPLLGGASASAPIRPLAELGREP